MQTLSNPPAVGKLHTLPQLQEIAERFCATQLTEAVLQDAVCRIDSLSRRKMQPGGLGACLNAKRAILRVSGAIPSVLAAVRKERDAYRERGGA